ncbi:predicted protein [Uncinocarpus reesii 1704]|uniref:Autophagy-related protein 14 n=1 Tax=Uncinocarpus reesii (strain UAMH 1704) TaxID=336963 RepID=C4JIE0_UNCRE|nr:uncharacterized protein UREG_01477 [Uncinocarpus reesii 1704]EEP76628.1 predicted protein [Uncinocarpus reesii 1704]
MSCQLCGRSPGSSLPFYCLTCARNQMYPLRFEIAKTLLEKEAAGQQIEEAVSDATRTDEGENERPGLSRWPNEPSKIAIETMRTLTTQSEIRKEAIQVQIARLRAEIEEGKEEIAKRRAALAKRRSDAESANYQLSERRAATLNSVQNEAKKIENAWNSLHAKTAESRMFLCREVASLYNLRQKSRRRNGEIISTYSIGGVNMVDPRDMNGASPAQITTSLSHIAHLLVLVSHYLALRLPAEITLPHRGYPLPTIFPSGSSYLAKDVPFPGLSPSNSFSPATTRGSDSRPLPRPRPLFLDRSLPKLAKEDPAGYTLFLEGVSLLAWNVSWVCRSQGLQIGQDSWEDVCEMGRNLWQLLVAPPALAKALAGRDLQVKPSNSKETTRGTLQRTKSLPLLGHYSHGTAHSFLGNAEGNEFAKTWKLPSALKVADKLKSTLLGEIASAEWELLEQDEWDEASAAQAEDGVVNGKRASSGEDDRGDADTRSTITVKAVVEDEECDVVQKEPGEPATPTDTRPKGTKGWTKVKSR